MASSDRPAWDPTRVRRRAAEAHDRVLARLARIAPPAYELQSEVKVGGTGGVPAILLDGLLVGRLGQPDLIAEIKLIGPRSLSNLSRRILEGVSQLRRYRDHFPNRAAVGWLILVADEPLSSVDREKALSKASRFSELRVSVVPWDEIESLTLPV